MIEQLLNELIVVVGKLKGTYDAQKDLTNKRKEITNITPLSVLSKKLITNEEFIKARFRDEPALLNQKLNNLKKELVVDDTVIIKNKEEEMYSSGSITQRKDGRFQAVFYFFGERKYVYGRTKTEARQKMESLKRELKTNYQNKDDERITKKSKINTWFELWFKTYKSQEVCESTAIKMVEVYDRYSRKQIGNTKIESINSAMLQNFITSIPTKTGREKTMQIFKPMIKALFEEGIIKKNYMSIVVLPKENREKKVIDSKTKEADEYLTYAEEKYFFNKIKHRMSHDIALFTLYTGLRRGEALGLTWKNVDIEKKIIHIGQAYNMDTKKITAPKTEAGIRDVPLMLKAYEVILKLNQEAHNENDLVFKGVNRFTQQLLSCYKSTGIHVYPHKLRHTFASRLYAAGVDTKIIQSILGHESVNTTLDTYTHVLDTSDKEIVQIIRNEMVKLGYVNRFI